MLITIRTGFKDVVRTLLIEQEILPLESKFRETGKHEPVIVECEDDLYYRSISTWAGDAIGCGLVTGAIMTEQGTVFQGRYRFESERPLSVGTCDCGGRYAIVVREYTDLHNRNEQGQYSRVETSVRTSCHCAEERDPFRVEQKPANVLNVTGDWRLEKVQRPIYRIHEGGPIEMREE